MTAERIASYMNGLGFSTDHTDSGVTVTVSTDVPLIFHFDINEYGLEAADLSDVASTFASSLDEYSMYAVTLQQRTGMNPSSISNLDLEDFQEIMASGALEKARQDVKKSIGSAWRLANGAKKLAESPEFMEVVPLQSQSTATLTATA